MTIYYFDDGQLDFDFYSTEPPVFNIVVRPREGYTGAFAEASFREGHDDAHLWSVTAWGETEDDALKKLLDELRQRYTVKPNRVVVEGLVSDVRAERPDEIMVIARDPIMGLFDPVEDGTVFGLLDGLPIKQLNTVKEGQA